MKGKLNKQLVDRLFGFQDLKYRDFQCKLMPSVDPSSVIGVRTPILRRIAKELHSKDESVLFMRELPHQYYEENNLHAFLIGQIKDFDKCICETERFLPYVNNWATCDSLRPRCFKNNTEKLLPYIEKWLDIDSTYTVRFAIELLMLYFLDEGFDVKYAEAVAKKAGKEYYTDMMAAWYFATALAKQWEYAVAFLEQRRLTLRVHNKTVQKALESYRITEEQKVYLKNLKMQTIF